MAKNSPLLVESPDKTRQSETMTTPTPLETARAQLAEVQAAISAVLVRGQNYSIMDGGAQRMLTRANLRHLEDRETKLKREVAALERAESGRGMLQVNYGMPK